MVYFNDYYTLVNGAHSDTITTPFQNISISLGGGDDSVKVLDVDVPWDVTVRLGQGADTAEVTGVAIGDDLHVHTDGVGGSGYDLVKVRNSVIGDHYSHGDLNVYGTTNEERVYIITVQQ